MSSKRKLTSKASSLVECEVAFVPRKEFEPHVQAVLRAAWHEVSLLCGGFSQALLEVHVVSDKRMKQLNLEHRTLDRVTDVISLDYGIDQFGVKLGVIYLARGVMRKLADYFQHAVSDEQVFLVVHGMLHIWGFDHEEKADETKMLQAMKIVLENFPAYTPLLATYERRSLIDY